MLESAPDIWPDSCCNLSSSLLVHYYMCYHLSVCESLLHDWRMLSHLFILTLPLYKCCHTARKSRNWKLTLFVIFVVRSPIQLHAWPHMAVLLQEQQLSFITVRFTLYADYKNTKNWQFPARVALQRQKRPFSCTPALLLSACIRSRTHTAWWIGSATNGKLITLYGRLDFCSISFWK